jgi:ABC-type multidrug transport system fused ATPase/permease subunit
VVIARALLKNAPILILDEATSALDSETELGVRKALMELMKGRTTIAIAHRLSTLQGMDRIVVIDDGKVVEEGRHKDLIKKKRGIYAKLWAMQSF